MHSAMDHDCDLNDRYGKPSCMAEYRQEIREEVIADCIAAVEALVDPWPTSAPGALPRDTVLAALRVLQEKP